MVFEEAAVAWAKLLMRAEAAEARVKELEAQLQEKQDDTKRVPKTRVPA